MKLKFWIPLIGLYYYFAETDRDILWANFWSFTIQGVSIISIMLYLQ